MEDQTVEVQINLRTRIFFTYFMDHLPEPVEITTNSGETLLTNPRYKPFSYLENGNYLLLAPLYPAIGNAQIRSSTGTLIRFFDGVKSYETTLSFSGTSLVRGEPAIALTFPSLFNLFRSRRFFRANLPVNIKMKLAIQVGKNEPMQARLINISPGGLSFCGAITPEELPIDSLVTILLEGTEILALQVGCIVRSHALTTPKEKCPEFPHRYGVQYEVVSEQMAMRIDEISAYAQRIHLNQALALRARFDVIEDQLKQEKPIPREQKIHDLMKFFGVKRN